MTLDSRPDGTTIWVYSGNTFTAELTFPASYLSGRTMIAELVNEGGQPVAGDVDYSTSGDVVTVTLDPTQTTAVTEDAGRLHVIDNTGGAGQVLVACTIVGDTRPATQTSTSLTFEVNDGHTTFPVTIDAVGARGPAGPGVPIGGTSGQALVKTGSEDYETGWHTLTASDVGADVSGAAASAVSAHVAATDPHGDRAYTDAQVAGKATTAALTTETNRAELAEAANAAAITAEATTRASADAANATAITNEAAARAGADTANADAITNEALTARAAETANSTAIADEIARATAVEATKADLVGGKVPSSQIPSMAIDQVYVVASQSAMLALAANVGDFAKRTDLAPAETFILSALPASTLGNWVQITTGGAVSSVNGQVGPVVLGAADVGADAAGAAATVQSNLTAEAATARAAEAQAALKGNNLSDLPSPAAARNNIGLGTAAVVDKVAAGSAGVLDATDPTTTNTRTPTDGSVTDAKISGTLSPSKITGTAVVTADSRLSDNRTPIDASVTAAKMALDVITSHPVRLVGIANIASLSGSQTVDGTATATGDLVLLTAQTTASQNGPWIANSGAWTRPTYWPAAGTINATHEFVVLAGSSRPKRKYVVTTAPPITVDTTSVSLADVTAQAVATSILTPANSASGTGFVHQARAVATSNVASLSGTTTIDGVALVAGDRVLLVAQTTASQNGPWNVAAGAWTRPTDWPAAQSTPSNASNIWIITAGTLFAGSMWAITTTGSMVVDTTGPTFVQPESNNQPWLIDIDPFPTAISQVNWDTINLATTLLYNGYKISTGAQNAEINFDVVLSAGTWTLEMICQVGTNQGIAAITLGGSAPTSLGGSADSIDQYAAAGAANQRKTITGMVIPATAKYRLRLLMSTKNASSSSFFGIIQHLQFRRTA